MRCIFCSNERPSSLEHVFPLAIGGHITTDRVCKECNSTLSRNNAFNQSQNRALQASAATAQHASLLRITLPCETALWLFMTSTTDRRLKLMG